MKQKNTPHPIVKSLRSKRVFTVEERERTVAHVRSGHWNVDEAAKKMHCSVHAVNKWQGSVKKNKTMYENAHRPNLVSKDRQAKLNAAIDETNTTGIRFSERKFHDMLQKAADETADQFNRDRVQLSSRFVRDYMNANGIKRANGQVVDNAHAIALKDPRHAASHAALMHSLHETIPNNMFFNLDKTSFECKQSDKEMAKTVYRGEREQSLKCDDPYPAGTKGNCAVHLFVVANAGGKLADLVYVVKDKHMPPDKIDVHKAPILDASMSSTAMSYVIFIGESTSNKDTALDWLFRNIVVPFVVQVRTQAGKNDATAASLTVDGDPRQLQVITGEGIRAEFLKANILASKSPASCTPIYQPLDVGKLFLSAKSCFRSLLSKNYTPENAEEVDAVKQIFLQHMQEYPMHVLKSGKPSKEMSGYFKDIMKCLLTMVAALRKTLNPETVKKSFKEAGVSPFDVEAIRKVCMYTWSPAEKKQFAAAIPELSRRIKANSELYEKDFEENKIPSNNKSKDGAPVHQRRALMLYAHHVLEDLSAQAAKRQKK